MGDNGDNGALVRGLETVRKPGQKCGFSNTLTTPCQGKCWRKSRRPRTRTAPDLLPTKCERAALDSEPLPLKGMPEREAGEISDAHVPERETGGEEDDIAVAPLVSVPMSPGRQF